MKMQRLVIALTALNLILALIVVLMVLADGGPATTHAEGPVLRAEAIELVDGQQQIISP